MIRFSSFRHKPIDHFAKNYGKGYYYIPLTYLNIKMMKAALLALLLVAILTTSLSAQDKVNFGQAIGAKVLFTDHGQPNSLDTLDLTNGLELVYIQGINKFLNFALPLKVSTAEVAGDINNRNIVYAEGQPLFGDTTRTLWIADVATGTTLAYGTCKHFF